MHIGMCTGEPVQAPDDDDDDGFDEASMEMDDHDDDDHMDDHGDDHDDDHGDDDDHSEPSCHRASVDGPADHHHRAAPRLVGAVCTVVGCLYKVVCAEGVV